jgi:hypothetical protein
MSVENSASESVAAPATVEARSLSQTLRGHVSLTRLQGICGMTAALLSIGGALGYFVPPKSDRGEVLAIVQEARSGKPVSDATVEVLTLQDALVTTLPPASGVGAARAAPMKEGTYRLRVLHPRYVTESRQIYVLAGQTAEIRLRLAPRLAPPPPAHTAAVEKPSGPFEGLKKLFR